MTFVTIEDETGDTQVVLWPDVHKQFRRELRNQVVVIADEISRWDGTSNTIVSDVRALHSSVRMPGACNWR